MAKPTGFMDYDREDPPHRPVACHAQAWSVAEALRALRSLEHD